MILFARRTVLAAALLLPFSAHASGGAVDSGDTAWMLLSTVLVLLMTIPGLARFYAGMVRKKNILATMLTQRPMKTPPSLRLAALPRLQA